MRLLNLIFVTALVAGIMAPGAEAQLNPGRLSGTLVDADGEPAVGVVLLLIPEERGSAQVKRVKVKKKGKFDIPFLPAGIWTIETEDKALFLESMSYVHRNVQGLKTADHKAKGHPTTGLPAIQVGVNGRGHIDLVLAETGYREKLAGQLTLQKVSGPLKKIVEQYEAGEMLEVVESAGKILAETPDLAEAQFLRGSAFWQLQRYEEAEVDLRAAEAAKPDLPQIQGILAMVLIEHARQVGQAGDAEAAKALFGEAAAQLEEQIRRVPDDPSFKVNRVVALEGAGATEGLEEAYLAVLEADSSNSQVAMRLAGLYATTERPDDAARIIEEMGLKGRDSANTLYNIAVGLYNDGHNDQAEAYAAKVRDADPDHAEVVSLFGYLRLAAGDTEAALASFREFVTLVPEDQSAEERGLIEALLAQKK